MSKLKLNDQVCASKTTKQPINVVKTTLRIRVDNDINPSGGNTVMELPDVSIVSQNNIQEYYSSEYCGIIGTIEEKQDVPEISLWRAVILQAILDATSNRKRSEDKLAKQNAETWISDEKDENFHSVCYLADFNAPEWVRKTIKSAMQETHRWKKGAKAS